MNSFFKRYALYAIVRVRFRVKARTKFKTRIIIVIRKIRGNVDNKLTENNG